MRFVKLLGIGVLCMLAACSSREEVIPADAPGFVKGKPVHPTIKIGKPYEVMGGNYYPKYQPDYDEEGIASWYGPNFHGGQTANGEEFNQWAMTAAHKTLPMPSMVRVTELETGKSIIVRINDRGPFSDGRIIDLSRAAAEALGVDKKGIAKVRVQYLRDETEQYIAKLQLPKPPEWQMEHGAPPVYTPPVQVASNLPPELPMQIQELAPPSETGLKPQPIAPSTYTVGTSAPPPETGYSEDPFSVLNTIVPPAHAAPAPRPIAIAGKPPQSSNYYVQAGAFTSRDNAMRLAGKLEPLGKTQVIATPISDATLWRVRIGPTFNKAIAEETRQKLTQYGVYDAQIVFNP